MPRLNDPFNTPIEDDEPQTRTQPVTWAANPDQDNAKDAANYLGLITGKKNTKRIIDDLANAQLVTYKAKDVLRAANLPPLSTSNPRVQLALTLIAAGTPLAPIYLVRGKMGKGLPLTIADGYHRTSAAWSIDPGADIAAFIVSA